MNRQPYHPETEAVARESHARALRLVRPDGTAPRAEVIANLRKRRTNGGLRAAVRVVRACYDEGVSLADVEAYLATSIWYARNLYASGTPRRHRPRAA